MRKKIKIDKNRYVEIKGASGCLLIVLAMTLMGISLIGAGILLLAPVAVPIFVGLVLGGIL